MAVNLTEAELIQPHGELDPSYFPSRDLNSKIGGWLAQATSKVNGNTAIKAANQNEAARQWVYYLAYDYLGNRYASMPSSASVNKGADSVSYAQDRPAHWFAKAQAALGSYNGFLINVVSSDSSTSGPIRVIVGY